MKATKLRKIEEKKKRALKDRFLSQQSSLAWRQLRADIRNKTHEEEDAKDLVLRKVLHYWC